MNNFTFHNPTRLLFGKGMIEKLSTAIPMVHRIMITFGGGSVKQNGVYDQVIKALKDRDYIEFWGIEPNPKIETLRKAIAQGKAEKVDFLLSVGGGSVLDGTKLIAAGIPYDGDAWELVLDEDKIGEVVPFGDVMTLPATGSEMNAGSVITNTETHQKIAHVFADEKIMPRFTILNPEYTFTLPKYQMVSGIYDIFNHICEQYFSDEDDNTSDYISEGLMRSVIHSSRIAVQNPLDYEARSNLMWTATWALNTLIDKGKHTDWMVHMLGQAVGGYTDATHGMTLSAVSLPYYRHILPYAIPKFKRFAVNVWNINAEGKATEQVAQEGLSAMEDWMREIGVVLHLAELGVTEDMLESIADVTLILKGGYHVPNRAEIIEILKESL